MKYLADRVAIAGKEHRVIADTESPETEVWGSDFAWEFRNRAAAYIFLAQAYKTAQDLRNITPGQEVVLTMADGTQKKFNVLMNDAANATLVNETGQQFNIPHMQEGAAPRILPKKNPAESGNVGTDVEQGEATSIEPGTGISYAKTKNPLSKKRANEDPLVKKYFDTWSCPNCKKKNTVRTTECSCGGARTAESFPHRHPQNCKHDGTYLQRKDPSDPEKACPQCGMVYEAATFNVFDEKPVFPKEGPKLEYRPFRCMNCGHEQMIQTNHMGKVTDYCKNCSWKPSFGNPDYAIPYNGRTYRPFEYAGPTDRTVLQRRNAGCDSDYYVEGDSCNCPIHKKALSKKSYRWQVGDTIRFEHPDLGMVVPGKIVKDEGSQYVVRHGDEYLAVPLEYIQGPQLNASRRIAQPQMPGPPGQIAPPASPPMSTQQTGPQQAPAGDQPQPGLAGGPGRNLSRHEIITESEILIRNALAKGIRIGTWDLVEYMRQNYSNPPEELYEGATKAWEKVQWEEQDAFEVAKGPGPQQKKGPGEEVEEEMPMSVEDVAQRPQTGPTQVKV